MSEKSPYISVAGLNLGHPRRNRCSFRDVIKKKIVDVLFYNEKEIKILLFARLFSSKKHSVFFFLYRNARLMVMMRKYMVLLCVLYLFK